MSEDKFKAKLGAMKENPVLNVMKEKPDPKVLNENPLPTPLQDDTIRDSILGLTQMFNQFMVANAEERKLDRDEFADLKSKVAILDSPVNSKDSPIDDRSTTNRRSSMFFGLPIQSFQDRVDTPNRPQIQILQADIVYEKELKVSSLEGLRYLAKQMQYLASKYPGREIKTAHMVSYTLRPFVIAAWNSHCYTQFTITGVEYQEIMIEDWLSLTNDQVNTILVEAARPRTKEQYARELVLFLGKGIPQTPAINPENFARLFYGPLTKSLNDITNLYDLLSVETSNHSNNKKKMPHVGYGTRDSPGHTQLWLYSLGAQKDSILQFLSKDELQSFKTIELAAKYIRLKLMEGKSQSEAHQDFNAKLTPIRYDDILRTQGESFTRHQVSAPARVPYRTPDASRHTRDTHFRPALAALVDQDLPASDDNDDKHSYSDRDDGEEDDFCMEDEDSSDDHEDRWLPQKPLLAPADSANVPNTTLAAFQDTGVRTSISATFRGFCSELFVFGKCNRSDCTFDHSPSGQERCIQSFGLLFKRETVQHSKLPPWSIPKLDAKPSSYQPYTRPVSSTYTPGLKPRVLAGPSFTPRNYNNTGSPHPRPHNK
jgi:hypothetical protein